MAAVAPATARPPPSGWLVSARWDLLLIANLGWPLIALLGWYPASAVEMSFLTVYFISASHRFITLPMVFLEPRFFPGQTRRVARIGVGMSLLALALLALGFVLPHPLRPGSTLVYLTMVDYVWNTWHFASQHAGIYRIYGRKVAPNATVDEMNLEKTAIRVMVIWVMTRAVARLVARDVGLDVELALNAASWLDPFVFVAPVWLLVKELRVYTPARRGRVAYLAGLLSLYGSMTLAFHFASDAVIAGVILAHAMFHATEYITVCGWAMQRKKGGVWDMISPNVVVFCLLFTLAVGALNYGVFMFSPWAWALMTLWIGYFHYAYDGIIWKAPKPAQGGGTAGGHPSPVRQRALQPNAPTSASQIEI